MEESRPKKTISGRRPNRFKCSDIISKDAQRIIFGILRETGGYNRIVGPYNKKIESFKKCLKKFLCDDVIGIIEHHIRIDIFEHLLFSDPRRN